MCIRLWHCVHQFVQSPIIYFDEARAYKFNQANYVPHVVFELVDRLYHIKSTD